MARSLTAFAELGERVALALDDAASERLQAIERARRGFTQQLTRPYEVRVRSSGRVVWAGGVALATALAAVALLHQRQPTALTFHVGGSPGVAKTWLAAPEASPLELSFSEGTHVRLEAASRARVVDIDTHGASLALESGHLHADVVHQQATAWRVVAGPYTVNVRGTVFDVSWDPGSEQLSVSVSRGVVGVQEAGSVTEQPVHALQTLRATPSQHRFDLSESSPIGDPVAQGVPAAAQGVPAAPSDVEEVPSSANLPAESADDGAPASPAPGAKATQLRSEGGAVSGWRELAKRGALREAFASADALGYANVCSSASPAELLLLGDGARLAGKPDQAVLALLTLRRRYPADPRRAAAAFSLGKVAFDQRRAYQRAAEWFSTSLREQPNGPLAREASGRLIEALRRTGDASATQRAARDYLAKYPEGPHADLARSALR